MKNEKRMIATLLALFAALIYASSMPFSKLLLTKIQPTSMAGLLYLGAGIGVGVMYAFKVRSEDKSSRLAKVDLPYTIGMILLDIAAPIFLMLGISMGTAANASLLGNFEIVATALIALAIFGEKVSPRLWLAIILITLSSVILSLEGAESFSFSTGSILVLAAAICWGLENNCTRKISEKSTYEIVMLKGIFSGSGSLVVANIVGEDLPSVSYIVIAMILGFLAYGLSIFMYIRAQRDLGAAKTSAYYAVAPFAGALFALLINGEILTTNFFIGLIIMTGGSILVVYDTLKEE